MVRYLQANNCIIRHHYGDMALVCMACFFKGEPVADSALLQGHTNPRQDAPSCFDRESNSLTNLSFSAADQGHLKNWGRQFGTFPTH